MIATLTIPGNLPNMNDYIRTERTSRYMAAEMKKSSEEKVEWCIKAQLQGVRFTKPVTMHYTWVEKNERRDKDNISSFGRKIIQDALVKSKVIPDDGWKHITGFSDSFGTDKQNPGIIVVITDE